MTTRIRRFTAAPDACRCVATVILRDGSTASCMRRATVGNLCRQHRVVAERRGI